MKSGRVLVTGGAGFIGSHLVDRLIKEGFEVTILDNLSSGRVGNIAHHFKSKKFKLVNGDIRNRSIVREYVSGVDAIIHLASLISVEKSIENPYETYEVNTTGTFNLLDEAVRKGVKRFVYASSTAVYGEENPLPLKEDNPLRGLISPYAASKASAECYCRALCKSHGLETVILRYFNVYGPRQERNPYSGVIAKFVKNCMNNQPLMIYGDGNQTRDFIYVDDVVEATMLALEKDVIDEIFNVCTGRPTRIKDLAQIVKEISGRNELTIIHDKPRLGDIKDNYGDPKKAEAFLGFRSKVRLEDGIRKLVHLHLRP
ncbi:MAG: SDR family NAD(P)-dependent oxidoreductase [Candidatus Methylarchaceae archaeon HK01M]|nr:SDR family NAD(P)-dependent oxidoreductase [Candidatus Methylarchaceae archaeon HK01M]